MGNSTDECHAHDEPTTAGIGDCDGHGLGLGNGNATPRNALALRGTALDWAVMAWHGMGMVRTACLVL